MIDEYLDSKVTTATPYQLHLMVIDGAIRNCQAAEAAVREHKRTEAQRALAKARQFVAELLAGLDASRMPEVVDKLKALFVFILRNLVKADLERDPQLVAESITLLRSHRETWEALAEQLKKDSVTQAAGVTQEGFSWSS
jgi:flagellar secretion chaperone FliS